MTDQRSYQKGEIIHGFTLLSVNSLEEYKGVGLHLIHNNTGLEVFHVANDDHENLFAFSFNTIPQDNSGVPHIVEHSVLSGSKRYPVKDPFLALMRGSVNTFLNAMTYPDKTVYPAASPLAKDYYNLFSVYGDAVFFPLLRKEVFLQEGIRWEVNKKEKLNKASKLVPGGIVFNEMLGAYSNHDSIAAEWSYRFLFPDTPYRFDAGGEPEAILHLNYEQFIDFHRTAYHPSNCKVFLYGNIPTEEQICFLEEQFLKNFGERNSLKAPPLQSRWNAPRRFDVSAPVQDAAELNEKSTITLNWLLLPVTAPGALLDMEILSEILLGNIGAPLYKRLIESGLGDDVSSVSGLERELREMVFTAGIRGSDPDKLADFEALVMDELKLLVQEGIPKDVLYGTIKRVEFGNREIKGGVPFGLRLMNKAFRSWLYEAAPVEGLYFNRPMQLLKQKIEKKKDYFEQQIQKYLIDNMHRSTVTVKPDPNYRCHIEEVINNFTTQKTQDLNEEALNKLEQEVEQMRKYQETPDTPEAQQAIPFITIDDLPDDIKIINTEYQKYGGVSFSLHDLFTNGIVYVDSAFPISNLSRRENALLPLLSKMIGSAGLPGTPYHDVARLLALKTGGIYSALESGTPVSEHEGEYNNKHNCRNYLMFRLKVLESDLPEALALFKRILLSSEVTDTERLEDVLAAHRADLTSGVIPSGNAFAALRSGAKISATYKYDELWRGLEQLFFIQELSSVLGDKKRLQALGEELAALRDTVFCCTGMVFNITAQNSACHETKNRVIELLSNWPETKQKSAAESSSLVGNRGMVTDTEITGWETFYIPAHISFVATAIPAAFVNDPLHPYELLAGYLLKTDFLWEQVRMKGGAYGVSAAANGMEGVFTFSSYRDPAIAATYNAYRQGLERLSGGNVSAEELRKGIISVVGKETRPLSPGEESLLGFRRFLYGVHDEMRRNKRRALINTKPENIAAAAQEMLKRFEAGFTTVLASKEMAEKEHQELPLLKSQALTLPL